MTDVPKVQRLLNEVREIPPLTPEWHAKCHEIEEALGLTDVPDYVPVPPGRFELTDEDFEDLPVLNMDEFEEGRPS